MYQTGPIFLWPVQTTIKPWMGFLVSFPTKFNWRLPISISFIITRGSAITGSHHLIYVGRVWSIVWGWKTERGEGEKEKWEWDGEQYSEQSNGRGEQKRLRALALDNAK